MRKRGCLVHLIILQFCIQIFSIGTTGSSTLSRGLKALKKESRSKLDAYQHLFYQLQTCPGLHNLAFHFGILLLISYLWIIKIIAEYLAKLIFVLPQSSSNKFIDSVIMTLYNFGSNPREEFMLLKLFQTALEEVSIGKILNLILI